MIKLALYNTHIQAYAHQPEPGNMAIIYTHVMFHVVICVQEWSFMFQTAAPQRPMLVPPLLPPPTCSEGHDRTELTLPGKQLDLIQTISGAISTPLIVVLMSGGPVDISWAKVTHVHCHCHCPHSHIGWGSWLCSSGVSP